MVNFISVRTYLTYQNILKNSFLEFDGNVYEFFCTPLYMSVDIQTISSGKI